MSRPVLRLCTLTGVDARTEMAALSSLSEKFPFVEWGFLFSPKQQGLPGRYPPILELQRWFAALPAHVRVALHVCGDGVGNLLAGEAVISTLVDRVAARGGRIQLNFNQRRDPVCIPSLQRFITKAKAPIITQHQPGNEALLAALAWLPQHAILFDRSGGRGQVPDHWPVAHPTKDCGYAGGLGPLTIRHELPRIFEATGGSVAWIDMETALREHEDGKDWFSLPRAKAVLETVAGVTS